MIYSFTSTNGLPKGDFSSLEKVAKQIRYWGKRGYVGIVVYRRESHREAWEILPETQRRRLFAILETLP